MRDPKRIKPFLKELEKLWLQIPDQRFAQLIVNLGFDSVYYLEDDVLLRRIQQVQAGGFDV